jgi:hypothetical protein
MRQRSRLAALAAALLAGVTAYAAAPLPVCQKTGKPPALNADQFSPVECSTTPKAALPLPAEPLGEAFDGELKALKGRWEAVLIKGFGRYATALEVKTGWGGKAELRLEWKEQQTRQTSWSQLALTPDKKERGLYSVVLTASPLPGAELKGDLRFSEETDKAGAKLRRADLSFANGAAHRVRWSFPSKDALRFKADWAVQEAPLQNLEGELKRVR